MRIILLGAPGAGKGTQAAFIATRYNIPAVSTGNMLRAAIASGSALGQKAKQYIDGGQLVPDEIVIAMVKERLLMADCAQGYLLDGFPRTLLQAKALSDMDIVIDVLLSIEVDDKAVIERISGRRSCLACGAAYHTVSNPPQVADVCDKRGQSLCIREDDVPETIKNRLAVYHKQTEPIKAYYAAMDKVKTVDGVGSVEQVAQRVFEVLGAC